MQLRNAKIKSTTLGFEDHGILTAYIQLDYSSSGQSFGGYGFGATESQLEAQEGFGATFIATILDVIGTDQWEKLPGKYVRVIQDNQKVYAIGNILENKWYSPGVTIDPEVQEIINDLDKVL
jgi:hypothetical protein